MLKTLKSKTRTVLKRPRSTVKAYPLFIKHTNPQHTQRQKLINTNIGSIRNYRVHMHVAVVSDGALKSNVQTVIKRPWSCVKTHLTV